MLFNILGTMYIRMQLMMKDIHQNKPICIYISLMMILINLLKLQMCTLVLVQGRDLRAQDGPWTVCLYVSILTAS
jgi:hypothetical protein